jgi:hypothetical protein
VFIKSNELEHNEKDFKDALDACNIEDIIRSTGKLEAVSTTNRSLLHYDVEVEGKSPYVNAKLVFASNKVTEEMYTRYAADSEEKSKQLMASLSDSEAGGLKGQFFESHCHRYLPKGGFFTIHRLPDGAEEKLQLQPMTVKFIRTASDITALTNNDYGRPSSKIFESIDALRKPDVMFQMTVSKPENKHIKVKGYEDARTALLGEEEKKTEKKTKKKKEGKKEAKEEKQTIRLYIVVPDYRYADYSKKVVWKKDNKVTEGPSKSEVEQWVMKVDVQPQIAIPPAGTGLLALTAPLAKLNVLRVKIPWTRSFYRLFSFH